MENKRTIIGIVIVLILIISLIAILYFYNDFNKEQVNLLTEETNNLLKLDIATEPIDLELKTEKNYSIIEKSIKEYLLKLKNIYVTMEETETQINPNDIFSANNIENKDFGKIETIISEYKEKAQNNIDEYKQLIAEENILSNINNKNITKRKEYYIDLYKTVMLSDVMKQKYETLGSQIERKKDGITDKLNNLENIKKFLKDNDKYWDIKDDKIQFTNINKMTEYYNLLNQLTD